MYKILCWLFVTQSETTYCVSRGETIILFQRVKQGISLLMNVVPTDFTWNAKRACMGHGGYYYIYVPTHAKNTKIGCKLQYWRHTWEELIWRRGFLKGVIHYTPCTAFVKNKMKIIKKTLDRFVESTIIGGMYYLIGNIAHTL